MWSHLLSNQHVHGTSNNYTQWTGFANVCFSQHIGTKLHVATARLRAYDVWIEYGFDHGIVWMSPIEWIKNIN